MANEVSYIQSPFNKSRKDKFLMVLTLPPALKKISKKFERTGNTVMPDTLQFSVYGAIVPEINIPPINVRYAGQTLAASSHSRNPYDPNSVNFTVDNRFNNYWVIYRWLDILNDDKTGTYDEDGLVDPAKLKGRTIDAKGIPNMEYRSDITIYALDEYNKRTMEFLYTNAFPISLAGIDYNYRNPEEIESSFTYSYSQLLINPVTSSIESL